MTDTPASTEHTYVPGQPLPPLPEDCYPPGAQPLPASTPRTWTADDPEPDWDVALVFNGSDLVWQKQPDGLWWNTDSTGCLWEDMSPRDFPVTEVVLPAREVHPVTDTPASTEAKRGQPASADPEHCRTCGGTGQVGGDTEDDNVDPVPCPACGTWPGDLDTAEGAAAAALGLWWEDGDDHREYLAVIVDALRDAGWLREPAPDPSPRVLVDEADLRAVPLRDRLTEQERAALTTLLSEPVGPGWLQQKQDALDFLASALSAASPGGEQ